ncbi:hypothetical protein BC833DRAFT_624275 [Globomyces pollinis-pini]|nr:hypothetical protein BC833DRAFT_624275 [Globomyces pollinis-pini]
MLLNFNSLSKEFNAYHLSHLNVLLHLFTTTSFYFSTISLLLSVNNAIFIIQAYCILLFLSIPTHLAVVSTTIITINSLLASYFALSNYQSIAIFICSYIAQDLAHYITNEETYQSAYSKKYGYSLQMLSNLFLHTFYMLPLVIASTVNVDLIQGLTSWFVVRDRIIKVKLKEEKADLKVIESWLDDQDLPKNITSHWWFASLPDHIRSAFDKVAHSPTILKGFNALFPAPEYSTIVLHDMNEIYVATVDSTKATSDNVFYSNHVDGPFLIYPCASVYRAIVAVNTNKHIKTIFPAHPCEGVLTDGDVWAFDFNREVHRIETVCQAENLRYNLKVHYLVYPTNLPFYGYVLGKLTSLYDYIARLAFLQTLVPKTIFDRALWSLIMLTTWTVFGLVRAAGNSGAFVFVIFTGLISYCIPTEIPLFLIATSFIHYLIYIGTYYNYETLRNKIAFEGFKQTVMFYKFIAFCHIISYYYAGMMKTGIDYISIAMIVLGFGLSTSAAAAIGLDQTYFGVELQKVQQPYFVTTFPYNLTKHPMIIGNIIGLVGFMKLDGFREAIPWLVPAHVAFYMVHMIQEHFDVHSRTAVKQD